MTSLWFTWWTSGFLSSTWIRIKNICKFSIKIDYSGFKEKKAFIGTTRYASIAAHKGYELGRKDDLESLFYVGLFLLLGQLPWQGINVSDKDRTRVVGEMKHQINPKDLCKDLPEQFSQILDYLKKMQFKQEPDYQMILDLLEKIRSSQEG